MALRVNYSPECEAMVNQLFKKQMELSYCFLSKVDYFTRYDVALNGFAIWADWMRDRMCTWAQQLVAYHSLRGASIVYSDISKPKVSQDEKPKAIMTSSLNCLNELYQNYNQLARKALEQGDGQTAQFIEAHMINELLVDMRVIAEVNAKLQDIKDPQGTALLMMLDHSLRTRFNRGEWTKSQDVWVPATCFVKKYQRKAAGGGHHAIVQEGSCGQATSSCRCE